MDKRLIFHRLNNIYTQVHLKVQFDPVLTWFGYSNPMHPVARRVMALGRPKVTYEEINR